MNYLDIIIAIPLLLGAYKGFRRGLIFEVAMIIGLIFGIYLAFKFSNMFESVVSKYFNNSTLLPYFSFFLIFSLVILAMVLLAKLFEGILKITNLNMFNKVAGALFGLLKFGLIISVLLAVFRPIDENMGYIKPEIKNKSVLYAPVLKISQYIFPALSDMQKVFKKNL